jgi:biotin operon repressor
MARKIIWNNTRYASLADMARDTGLSRVACRRRINANAIDEADYERITESMRRYRPVCVSGAIYNNRTEAARELGLSREAINEMAVDMEERPAQKRKLMPPYVWNGNEYATQLEMAEACGITIGAVRYRVLHGLTDDSQLKGGFNGKR